jgi:Nif-specific regulatory protein
MTGSETPAGGEAVADAADVRQIAALSDVSQALSGTLTLRSALIRILEILERQYGLVRGAVMLKNAAGQLHVEATHGIAADRAGTRYGLAEGVTARVVESGKPVIVPQVSREPMFRDRVARGEVDRRELTFLCLPIMITRRSVGALAMDLPFRRHRDYDHLVRSLRLVASMIAQAVRVERLVDSERQRLLEENSHLREELRERYVY